MEIELKRRYYAVVYEDAENGVFNVVSARGNCRASINGDQNTVVAYGHYNGEQVGARPRPGESLESCAHRVLTENGWESPWRIADMD